MVLAQAEHRIADVAPIAGGGKAEGAQEVALAPSEDGPVAVPVVLVAVDIDAARKSLLQDGAHLGLGMRVVGHHEDGLAVARERIAQPLGLLLIDGTGGNPLAAVGVFLQ